jgi:hypothetical protein
LNLPGDIEFRGTKRFDVVARLGAGGMGVVYSARDRERGVDVAIKTLRSMNPEALLRFKHEFRALEDLQHPNLVSLGELIEEGGQWFFTMELVSGLDLLSYVGEAGQGLHEDRLRTCLAQLGRGLCALHDAGKVHRDIKPSNILVTREGRLVLVDFGLVADLGWSSTRPELRFPGTTAYMAPEQVSGHGVGPAADWFSVGVILYQALSGRLPLVAAPVDSTDAKARPVLTPPRALAPQAPADLSALCVALLEHDASARPSGREIMRWLAGRDITGRAEVPTGESLGHTVHFVGREAELDVLRQAFRDSLKEKTVSVLVHGESGIGKTALVHKFISTLTSCASEVVVLEGRCHEREWVPFKALDGVVDALGRYMRRLPKIDAVALLPVRAVLLGQVFPALRQVEAVAELPRPLHEVLDPIELRHRVFVALRQLFARLCERHPVVMVINDLHWADPDSLALLRELLRPPESPALLLIATVRGAPGALMPAFPCEVRQVPLSRLGGAEAQELARVLLERMTGDAIGADELASEAEGHPLFIDELVRHSVVAKSGKASHRLEDALGARIDRLEPVVQTLLQFVVIAGAPLPQTLLAQAAHSDLAEFPKQLAALRLGHLANTTGPRTSDPIELYHGRVRDAVLARLDDKTRQRLHERLAVTMEAVGGQDPESLAVHWSGAGDRERAARHAETAAVRASEVLAFDRAARLYRMALEHLHPDRKRARALEAKLGEALASAGRGPEAAAMFEAASVGANAADALDLQRRATEQLLSYGHVDQGLVLCRRVLSAVGLSLPDSPRDALLSLVWHRLRIRLRGLRYVERDENELTRNELMRIDVCGSMAVGLAVVDLVRGADFQARHLLLALRAGEPFRIARGLALEVATSASKGGRSSRRTAKLLATTLALANRQGHPEALGLAYSSAAIAAGMEGRWQDCVVWADKAETVFRERCTGASWFIASLRMFTLTARYHVGDLVGLVRCVEDSTRDAAERGDLYTLAGQKSGDGALVWLLADDPGRARREAEEVSHLWSREGTLIHEYLDLVGHLRIDLYEGRGAWERLTERWPGLERSLLLHVQLVRGVTRHLYATSALAAARETQRGGAEHGRLLRHAERAARRLEREKMPWTSALALLVRAGIAAERRLGPLALSHLDAALVALEGAGMALLAAAARRQRGLLLGGDEGKALVIAADAWMTGQGARNPARIGAMLIPPFPELLVRRTAILPPPRPAG